jgi:LysM repeat protein
MIRNGFIYISVFLAFIHVVIAQDKKTTAEEYIATYKDLAVSEMKRTGIPASITLAQGLLESGNGNSYLAREANNHFGIKCKSNWTGKSVTVDDDALQECFRAYDKVEDSYKDHSDFLTVNSRYAFLFKLESTDYKGWAKGLKQAGYATNPKYPEMIIQTIEKYELNRYDEGRLKSPDLFTRKNNEPRKNIFGKTILHSESIRYNDIPAYEIKPGDTYGTIADGHNMMRWEIRKYNDLMLNEPLKPGTVIYLKPKRRKGHEEIHTVKEGEGMYYISQYHGIKLRLLYKWNRMEKGQEPAAGEKLYLRRKRDVAPLLKPAGTIIERKGVILKQEIDSNGNTDANQKINQSGDSIKNKMGNELSVDTVQQIKKLNDPVKVKREIPDQHIQNKLLGGYGHDENGNLFIYHIVQEGETVKSISKKYHVADTTLRSWNHLTGEVQAGDKIYLTKTEPKIEQEDAEKDSDNLSSDHLSDTTAEDIYIVSKGETLYGISRKLNVPVDSIIRINGLKNYALYPGQKLKIHTSNAVSENSEDAFHVVLSGETLYSISKKYGVTVEELVARNGLKNNSISVGQKLRIRNF